VSEGIRIGAVIRQTFRIYVDQAPVLMPAAAVVFALSGVLATLLIAASPGLTLIALVIAVLATTLFTGMIVELVAALRDGRRDASVGRLLEAIRPVLGQLIAVGIAVPLAVGLIVGAGVDFVFVLLIGSTLGDSVAGSAFGVLVGAVLFLFPALYLQTVWSLAAPVVVLERPGGLRALRRSRELVRGNGWRVFGVVLLLVILVGGGAAAGAILAGDLAGAAAGLVARVVLGILAAPISALAEAVLYFDLRAARANADEQPPEDAGPPEETGAFQAGPFPPAAP
jgi:hypothetical protein